VLAIFCKASDTALHDIASTDYRVALRTLTRA
jgi:hypothetical protein